MLIGIDASRANKPLKAGPEWYSYHLIRELSRIDPVNQYILYSDKPLTGGMADLTKRATDPEGWYEPPEFDRQGYQKIISSFGNVRGKILGWPLNFLWTQGRFALEMAWRRPDVLFVPAHVLPLIHPRNSVATIHDIGFERDRKLFRRDLLGPVSGRGQAFFNLLVRIFTKGRYGADTLDYLSWSTLFQLRHSKRIIVPSSYTKEEVIRFYKPPKDNVAVIHNGYDPHVFHPIDDERRLHEALERYDITLPYLMYIGKIERKKNIPALVEAFAIMREANKPIRHKLVLAGNAHYGYDEVNYVVQEYGIRKEVIMPGWIKEADLPLLYNAADAFIFPSKHEGFGMPVLEAMACGTPVLAARASSLPEIAGDAALFFDPDNIYRMAEQMARLLTDEGLKKELGRKGLLKARDYSWEKCAKETLALLQEAAGRS